MEARVALLEQRVGGPRGGAPRGGAPGGVHRGDDNGGAMTSGAAAAALAARVERLAARVAEIEAERPALAAARLRAQERQIRVAALATDAETLMLNAKRIKEMHEHCEEIRTLAAGQGVVDQDAIVPDAVVAKEVAVAKLAARRSAISQEIRALVGDYALWIDSVNATLLATTAGSS